MKKVRPSAAARTDIGAKGKGDLPDSPLLRPKGSLGVCGSTGVERKGVGAAEGRGAKGFVRRESAATTTEVGDERHSGDSAVGWPAEGKNGLGTGAGVMASIYPPTRSFRWSTNGFKFGGGVLP